MVVTESITKFKKIDIKNLTNATIDRARDHPEDATVQEDFDAPEGDEFESIYKGEVSKSGQAILPSKRSRKVPVASAAVADDADDSDDDVSEDIVDQTTEANPTEDKPSE